MLTLSSLVGWTGWFDKHQLFGVPLDIPAHFIAGLIIYLLFNKALGFRRQDAFLAVVVVALSKELIDLRIVLEWNLSLMEPVYDFSNTLLGTPFVWALLAEIFFTRPVRSPKNI